MYVFNLVTSFRKGKKLEKLARYKKFRSHYTFLTKQKINWKKIPLRLCYNFCQRRMLVHMMEQLNAWSMRMHIIKACVYISPAISTNGVKRTFYASNC